MPPLPKEPSLRQRTNRTAGARTLTTVHDVTAPPLPRGRVWGAETLAWWTDIWASPMAPEYHTGSDPHGLFVLAALVDDFWSADSSRERAALAAEIRLQRQCFGLTPIDRRRLQWEVDRGEAAEEQTVRRRAERRPRGAVSGKNDPRNVLAM